jgi:hypothetical protein
MLGAARRAHVARTVHRRGSGGGVTGYSGGSGGGLETSRGGAGGGPEPVDIEGARSRSHGPAVERPALGLGEPESTPLDWDNLPGRATRLIRLE